MARYDYRDIVLELVELCRELKTDIVQQLTYYRASVYKHETAALIERKVAQLELVCQLLGRADLDDTFHDYVAMKVNSHQWVVPGECPMSVRVTNLISATDKIFEQLLQDLSQTPKPEAQAFERNLQRHRRDLLSMCRQGSRQWAFFNTL